MTVIIGLACFLTGFILGCVIVSKASDKTDTEIEKKIDRNREDTTKFLWDFKNDVSSENNKLLSEIRKISEISKEASNTKLIENITSEIKKNQYYTR